MSVMESESIRDDPRSGARGPSAAYGGMVLERLARHTCRVAGVRWSCMFVRDRSDPRLVIIAAGCGLAWELIGTRFAADEGVVGRVLRSGDATHVDDLHSLAGPMAAERTDGPALAVPIAGPTGVAGVLAAAMSVDRRPFGVSDAELLRELADLAAAALANADERQRLHGAVRAQVDALAAAMDMRDRRTAEHSEDVVALAVGVGELLELEPASLLELEFAARLHDVGKIRVPDSILHKPGPLAPPEAELIRCHAAWGADMLAQIPGLQAIATIVRFHHERWDGSGYPDGLAGARIPLASRIIAACDAFGAMTSERAYRPAISAARAIHQLRAGAGAQFDPAVVAALIESIGHRAPAAR